MDRRTGRCLLAALILVIAVGGVLLAMPQLRSLLAALRGLIPGPIADEPIPSDGTYTNVIFLHHSTGRALIAEGNVRALLSRRGYQFWDHGYNQQGLIRPDGTPAGGSYRIPGNRGRGNTDVDGLVRLFSQPVTDLPSNAFSRLLQHEVIIFKSCFPNSAVEDQVMEEALRESYLQIRDVIDQHPDHVFILVTSPPLHPLATNRQEAARARAIADWLASDAFHGAHPNLFVFDLFDRLADPETHMLRAGYQKDTQEPDSHPNRAANETIGPQFVEFIDQSAQTYRDTALAGNGG